MWSLLTNQRFPLPQLMTRLFVVIIANQIKEETRLLIVRTNNCKAGAKKSKQGRGNKLWIREFWRSLCAGCAGCAGCPGVHYKAATLRDNECLMSGRDVEAMWCVIHYWHLCFIHIYYFVCIFDYYWSRSGARLRQSLRYHRVLIVSWWGRLSYKKDRVN